MAAKKRNTKSADVAAVPKGFTAIEGGYAANFPNEDTKAGEALQGVVIGYRKVQTKHAKNDSHPDLENVCTIETADGTKYDVWRSATNVGLFEEDFTDVEVFIRYDGLGKKQRGKNPAKLFTLAFKE